MRVASMRRVAAVRLVASAPAAPRQFARGLARRKSAEPILNWEALREPLEAFPLQLPALRLPQVPLGVPTDAKATAVIVPPAVQFRSTVAPSDAQPHSVRVLLRSTHPPAAAHLRWQTGPSALLARAAVT